MNSNFISTLAASSALLLAACATPPPAVSYPASASPAPAAAPTPVVAAPVAVPATPAIPVVDTAANDRAIQTATEAYDRGDFNGAVRQINIIINDGALDPSQMVRALKVLAFSQCSSNAVTSCRQSFERALRVDPNFELSAAERGHPIWGAQFTRARRTVLGK